MNDRNDRGLSDALGAVVLISVVALGVTLFGVAILSGPLPDRVPALNAEVTNTSDTVFIRHTGGDTLVNGEYRILADGSDRTSDFLSGGAVPARWSVGDTLEYHLQPNEEIPSSLHIIAITGKSEYVILQVQIQPPTIMPTYTVTSTAIITTPLTPVPPPLAGFSASPLSGTRPLPVQFTDTSTNSPSSWSWNFGDGGTSTLQSPSHTYTTAGTYTVTLTALNAGGSDSETKTDYITVINPPPGVIFSDNFDASFSGWTTTGDVSRYTGTPHNGTAGVRIRDTGGMTRTIPTTGYSDITVSFSMGANNLDSGEYVVAEWSADRTTWQVLKQINNGDPEEDNALHPFSYALPANAGNNAAFSLRFRVLGSNPSDHGFFDDIVVGGIPL